MKKIYSADELIKSKPDKLDILELNEDGSPQKDSSFVYYYNIFENGNYHIRLFDSSTGEYIYDDYINVTNLAYNIILEPETDTEKPVRSTR